MKARNLSTLAGSSFGKDAIEHLHGKGSTRQASIIVHRLRSPPFHADVSGLVRRQLLRGESKDRRGEMVPLRHETAGLAPLRKVAPPRLIEDDQAIGRTIQGLRPGLRDDDPKRAAVPVED